MTREFLSCSLANSSAEDRQRIGNGAAKNAGVQVLRGPGDFDFVVVEAAQGVGDRRDAAREHAGVRDDQGIGFELRFVVVDVVPKAFAADFFLAFDQDFDIDGQLAGGLLQGVEGADVDMDLAFVVGGAAAEEIAAANGGLEGRRGPQIERLGGLNVVMAVEKDGGLAGRVQRFRVDQRMQLGRNDFDVGESGAAEPFGNPLGGALDVRLVLALRADAGNAQESRRDR